MLLLRSCAIRAVDYSTWNLSLMASTHALKIFSCDRAVAAYEVYMYNA